MSSTWELKEHSVGELKTTVSGEIWKDAQKKALASLIKKVNLPGFRKGKVPASLAKKQIHPQSVLMEAVDLVANDALAQGIQEHKLQVIARPQLGFDAISEEEVAFKFMITVKPEVKLGEYKGLKVKKGKTTVSKAEVDEQLVKLQERFANLVVKEDGAVEENDTAVIDFEGFRDGVAFEGGKGENYPLQIGSGTFIPGFEEQLIGMKAEETKDIQVTFPKEYQATELAGQEVTFKVTVHEIKYKELPELDDELVKQAGVEGVETLKAYKDHVKKDMKAFKEKDVEEKFTNDILTKVVEAAKVDIPQVMIDNEVEELYRDFTRRLQSQGFGVEQYMQLTGMTEEKVRGEIAKDAEKKVMVRLVLEAIADAEKIEVSEEEIKVELENIAKTYNMEVDKIKGLISQDAVSYDLRMRKSLELIKESVTK
ncbi:MAG: trigger factor [Erysipelotrichaceae bacterium]|nr:trigger factor [Erysipelotrichaceae bacterium]